MGMDGFYIEHWDDFVKNFAAFVDKWEAKKKVLLERLGGAAGDGY